MSDPVRAHVPLVPVPARQPPLDPGMAADDALRLVLLETLAQVRGNVPVVVQARDSEGLHQLRVGLRRLRTVLKMTGHDELDARAKGLLNTIGPARDGDVFLTELLLPVIAELGSRRGFDVLRARAERARDQAWAKAVALIAGPEFRGFDEDVAAAAVTWPDPAGIRAVAPAILDAALARARKRGRPFDELDPPERHRLRIALKKLRYAAEFFAPLYPKKTVKAWLKPLKELQDMLGHLNDVAQVESTLERLILGETGSALVQADLNGAAALLTGHYQVRADDVAAKAGKRWKKFRDAAPFWV